MFIVENAYRVGVAGTYGHECHVYRQSVHPGADGALEAEAVELLPGADEGFLGQVFRAGMVEGSQAKNGAIDPARMLAVELLERLPAAADGSAHHIVIGRGNRQLRLHEGSGGEA